MKKTPDIFGQALLDYSNGTYIEDIIVHSSIAHDDIMPIPYLFRGFEEMPLIEQKALEMSMGKVLDVGCCAASHSIHLQEKGFDVTGIDISKGAIALSRKRNLRKAYHKHILHHIGKYGTILLLMNGTGIFESLSKIDTYLQHLKSLLKQGGQILLDGSDIKYMFEDNDGGYCLNASADYYGEVTMAMSYKGVRGPEFSWLYLDYQRLEQYAQKNELNCELILEGDHYDYLARLTVA